MNIQMQYEMVDLLAKANSSASRLKSMQSQQTHKEVSELSDSQKNSAFYSRWLAVTTIASTLIFKGGCTFGENYCKTKNLVDFFSALKTNGNEIGSAIQQLTIGYYKATNDAEGIVLKTKIDGQNGQGQSSAKATEDEVRQIISTISQQFQRSIASQG